MDMVGWKYACTGSARRRQRLELQKYCILDVVGKNRYQRYHVLEVFEKPTTNAVFYRPNNEKYTCHEQVFVPRNLMDDGNMIVYKIQYGLEVYIGSTKRPRRRISEHFNGHNHNPHTQFMLQRGGTFEVLEHITTTEDDLRLKEQEYIKEYSMTGMFIMINNAHAKVEKD